MDEHSFEDANVGQVETGGWATCCPYFRWSNNSGFALLKTPLRGGGHAYITSTIFKFPTWKEQNEVTISLLYRAGLKQPSQVWWIWGEWIAFYCLQRAQLFRIIFTELGKVILVQPCREQWGGFIWHVGLPMSFAPYPGHPYEPRQEFRSSPVPSPPFSFSSLHSLCLSRSLALMHSQQKSDYRATNVMISCLL